MSQTLSRASTPTGVPAVCVPLLLLAYGVLRSVDRIDGTDQSGWLWVTGHLCFLAAILGVATIDLLLRRRLGRSIVADLGVAAGLAGCAAFVWVILGDIFPSMGDALPTPDLVTVIGPPAFLLGLLTLLGLAAHRGRFPWPYLAIVVLGFACVVASLDLLPLAALLLLLGLTPLRSGGPLAAHTRVDAHRGEGTRESPTGEPDRE